MIDRVLNQLENEKDQELDDNNRQKNDFLLDNFFKVYDREPEPRVEETEIKPSRTEHRKNNS